MQEVCYNGTQNNADNRSPVDGLDFNLIFQVCLTVGKVVDDQDGADGRQGAVQDVEPAAEVPVKPYSADCADDTGNENHGLLGPAEDV